jgi:hypothetical protein
MEKAVERIKKIASNEAAKRFRSLYTGEELVACIDGYVAGVLQAMGYNENNYR